MMKKVAKKTTKSTARSSDEKKAAFKRAIGDGKVPTTESIGRDFTMMLNVAARVATAYTDCPRDERTDGEAKAAMIIGITDALLRAGNVRGLAGIVDAISQQIALYSSSPVAVLGSAERPQ